MEIREGYRDCIPMLLVFHQTQWFPWVNRLCIYINCRSFDNHCSLGTNPNWLFIQSLVGFRSLQYEVVSKRMETRHIYKKEGNVLFNDALNTFYLRLYGIRHGKDHSARKETHCCHMGYSFRLAARDILYASSHRQDNIPQFFYTSRGALDGTRNIYKKVLD